LEGGSIYAEAYKLLLKGNCIFVDVLRCGYDWKNRAGSGPCRAGDKNAVTKAQCQAEMGAASQVVENSADRRAVLGAIFFRFVNLDRKMYWIDEAYTSWRISGYTEAELIQQVSNGQPITVKELAKFQHINSEKSVSGTIQGLAVAEPQLPPLYFVLARFWVQCFGASVAVTRSLSAVFSLLSLPCLY